MHVNSKHVRALASWPASHQPAERSLTFRLRLRRQQEERGGGRGEGQVGGAASDGGKDKGTRGARRRVVVRWLAVPPDHRVPHRLIDWSLGTVQLWATARAGCSLGFMFIAAVRTSGLLRLTMTENPINK